MLRYNPRHVSSRLQSILLSSGILYSRLQRVTIPDAVIIQFVLLKMGMLMLEHVEDFNVTYILLMNYPSSKTKISVIVSRFHLHRLCNVYGQNSPSDFSVAQNTITVMAETQSLSVH